MKRTENKIRKAFQNATPNVLNTVLSECCEEKGTVIPMTEKKKNKFKLKEFAATAAAVVLLFGVGYFAAGMIGSQGQFSQGQNNDTQPQIISKEKAEQIAFVDYFDYTISSPDVQPATTTELRYEADSTSYRVAFTFQDKSITYSIDAYTGEILDVDSFKITDIEISWKEARDAALSHAGVKLNKLTELDIEIENEPNGLHYDVSFDTLLQEFNYSIDAYSATVIRHSLEPLDSSKHPETRASCFMLRTKAVEIALNAAGVSIDDLMELDTDIEELRYEIEFKTESGTYAYEINVTNGEIISPVSTTPAVPDGKHSEKQALERAIEHFELEAKEIMGQSCVLDKDDEFPHYDVKFYHGSYEYECEVGLYNGEIRDAEKEPVEYGNASGSPQLNEMISQKKALELAIEHFKLERDKITNKECEIDDDSAKLHYDVSFNYGGYEYECEVDATDGTVRNAEKELDD